MPGWDGNGNGDDGSKYGELVVILIIIGIIVWAIVANYP